MKKYLTLASFTLLLFIPFSAFANSAHCYPSVDCDTGQDAYGTPILCRQAMPLGGTSCNSAGLGNAFSCTKGCYTMTSSVPKAPTCPVVTLSGGTIVPALTWVRDGDIGRIVECTTGMMHEAFNGLWVNGVSGSVIAGESNNVVSTDNPSFAMGRSNSALGWFSTAMGISNTVNGDYSSAIGYNNTSNGQGSVALGMSNVSNSQSTVALGDNSQAIGLYAVAIGSRALANELYSVALGRLTTASGQYSASIGSSTTASGNYSTAMGNSTTAQAFGSTVLGRFNTISGNTSSWVATDPLFVIGNGSSAAARSNALTVKKNGDTDIRGQLYIQPSGETDTGLTIYSKDGLIDAQCLDADCRGAFFNANGINVSLVDRNGFGLETNAKVGTSHLNFNSSNPRVDFANAGFPLRILNSSGMQFQNDAGTSTGVTITGTGTVTAQNGSNGAVLGGSSYGVYGWGTTYGTYGVSLANSATNNYAVYAYGSNTGGGKAYGVYSDAGNNYFADRVGIGIQSPTYKLQLPNVATDDGGRGRANAWTTYSDSRVKMNQKNLSYGLKEILALAPKSYDHYSSSFKDGNLKLENESAREIGLIAQEVYKFIPEAVNKPSDESLELWGMDYDKLAPVFINAIKELKSEKDADVAELKAETEALRAEVDALKAEIQELKSLFAN